MAHQQRTRPRHVQPPPPCSPTARSWRPGKSRIVYLLNGSSLGGIGGQEAAVGGACGDDIDGGVAVVGTTVYLPCVRGTIAVAATTSPDQLRLLWSSSVGGGPPIVAAGLVWTIGQNGVLYGLNPSTGAPQEQATIGVPANHFPTPSVGEGLLLAPAADRVVAFSAPSAAATTTTTTTAARRPPRRRSRTSPRRRHRRTRAVPVPG